MGTTVNGIYLPALGEKNGWDDEINNNFLRLGDLGINVKGSPFNAVGDGVADDTAEIQAAINAVGVRGRLYFPPGIYKTSAPLTVGSATLSYAITVEGPTANTGAGAPAGMAVISNTHATGDAIQVTAHASAGVAQSFQVRGLQITNGGGTGAGIRTTGYLTGPVFENLTVQNAGVGLALGNTPSVFNSLSAVLRDVTFHTCTIGLRLDGYHNLLRLDNVTCETGTNGISALSTSALNGPVLRGVVFENLSGAGMLLGGGARELTCENCWWEGNTHDAISFSLTLNTATFIGCRFDMNNQASRHILNNTAAQASGVLGRELAFTGCYFANIGTGGRLTNVGTYPTSGAHAGFRDITILPCSGAADIHGVQLFADDPASYIVIRSRDFTAANIIAGGGSVKPAYLLLVKQAGVPDATDAATAITQLNALLARVRTLGLISA